MRRIRECQKSSLAPDPFPALVEFGGKGEGQENRSYPTLRITLRIAQKIS